MFKDKVQRYSIRKLSVGAASVLIGLAFLSNNNDKVQAAENKDGQQPSTEEKTEGTNVLDSTKENNIQEVSDPKQAAEETTTKFETQTLTVASPKADEETNTPDLPKGLSESKVAVKSTASKQDKAQDKKQDTYKVHISFIDETTGKPIMTLNRDKWAYEYVPSLSGEFKAGDEVEFPHMVTNKDGSQYEAVTRPDIYYSVPGYKLMNEDEIKQAFPQTASWGSGVVMTKDHDINIVYKYAPLADTLVKYVDEDTGHTLASVVFPNKRLNVETGAHKIGAIGGIDAANYEAQAIEIPGYKLVSDPLIRGKIKDTEVKKKNDPNPTVLVFKYKKVTPNEVPEDINLNNNAGSKGGVKLSTSAWAAIPGMFTDMRDPKTGRTITTDGRLPEEAAKELIDRYTKQGFTYAGTSGKIYDNEVYNDKMDGTNIHLIPNQPVTVKYVDENGKEIAASDALAFNHNNPDQTNQGINEDKYWHPEGEWTTTAKDIKGYDHVNTIGAEKGKFTLFKYTVTYVYAKHVDGGIKYIDDTAKKDLASDKFEGTVGKNIDYTTADKIANYEKLGYKLVSNNFNDGKQLFAKDGNNFEVHLVHATEVKPENKTITRVVNYVDENGKSVAGSVTQTAKLTGASTIDKVTGETISTEWGKANFAAIATPAVENYHFTGVTNEGNLFYNVDKANGNVAAAAVTNKDDDTVVTVHFAKNAAQGTVTYIDDVTSKTLKTDDLNGEVGEKISYTTADKIKNFEDKGYKLVKSNFQDGQMTFANEGNNYEVHFAHATEVKPESKTITRVVNYVDENGKSIAGSVTQTAKLTGSITVDKVTGETISTKWGKTNFAAIATPEVKDYHVTNVTTNGDIYYSVEKSGDVAATAVTEKNGNTEVTVHFAKNAEPEKPVIPDQPTPEEPADPEPETPAPHDEDVPVTPSEETEDVPAPHGQDIPTDPSEDEEEPETVMPHASAEPEAPKAEVADEEETVKPHAATLPQTGAKEDSLLTAVGIALLGLVGIAAVGESKKRRN